MLKTLQMQVKWFKPKFVQGYPSGILLSNVTQNYMFTESSMILPLPIYNDGV